VCGIVGLFSKTGEAETEGGRPLGDVLVEMCLDLYRRGPDTAGFAL
jgi:glutamate synthase domain-containing protein 1